MSLLSSGLTLLPACLRLLSSDHFQVHPVELTREYLARALLIARSMPAGDMTVNLKTFAYAPLLVDLPGDPAYLREMLRLVGTNERVNGQLVSQMLAACGLGRTSPTTPWCAAGLNWAMTLAGVTGTGSAAARSFLKWGDPVTEPQRGDVVVFTRPGAAPGSGHVSLYLVREKGSVVVLGANQGDQVCAAPYSADRVVGYRRQSAVLPVSVVTTPKAVTPKKK